MMLLEWLTCLRNSPINKALILSIFSWDSNFFNMVDDLIHDSKISMKKNVNMVETFNFLEPLNNDYDKR